MLKIDFIFFAACWFQVSNSYDISGILTGNRMASVPLGRSLGDGILDIEGICSAPGIACSNCSHAVTCVVLPTGWLMLPLTECPAEETCNARLGGCSKQPVPECEAAAAKYQHVCNQVGIFPDAFDCRKFHLCSPPAEDLDGSPAEHRPVLCPRHYGYDPYTAQCSVKLVHGQCDRKPVPDCQILGQTDVLPHSPNHYYICLSQQGELIPHVFICPHGWYFWEGFCRPEKRPESTTPVEMTTSTVPTTTKLVETTKKGGVVESSEESGRFDAQYEGHIEKEVEYKPDTFLADKYDLTGVEMNVEDNVQPSSFEFNSFESGFSDY